MDLPVHADQAEVSMTLALGGCFEGGGTKLVEAAGAARGGAAAVDGTVRPGVGEAVVFDSSLRHAAAPVTRGTRYILALFLYYADS